MTLLAGTLIDEARDLHVSFSDNDHPTKLLLRELDRYQKALLSRALIINEDYLSSVQQTAMPLAVFANGITLPVGAIPTRAEFVDLHTHSHELEIKPWAYRQDPVPPLCLFKRGGVVFLRGQAADWTSVTRIDIYYQSLPTDLTALTGAPGTLTIGDSARPALVARLAMLMAKRGHTQSDLPKPDKGDFIADFNDAEQRFFEEIAMMRSGETHQIREVW